MRHQDEKSLGELWLDFRNLEGFSQADSAVELGHRLIAEAEYREALGIAEFLIAAGTSLSHDEFIKQGHIVGAQASRALDEHRLAVEHLQWIITTQTKDDDLLGAVANSLELARAHMGMDQYMVARDILLDNMAVATSVGDKEIGVRYFLELSHCYMTLEHYDRAEEILRQGIVFAREHHQHYWVVRFRHYLGTVLRNVGREKDARKIWRDTFHAAVIAEDDEVVAVLSLELGKTFLDAKEKELARDIVDIGLMASERLNQWSRRGRLHYLMSQIQLNLFKNKIEARDHAARARAIFEIYEYPDAAITFGISMVLLKTSSTDPDLTEAAMDSIIELPDPKEVEFSDQCWAAYYAVQTLRKFKRESEAQAILAVMERRRFGTGNWASPKSYEALMMICAGEAGHIEEARAWYQAFRARETGQVAGLHRSQFARFALKEFDKKWRERPSVSTS